ncbi:MAG: hypothetical protein Kow0092_12510 [Deferrisomatales bacterium]
MLTCREASLLASKSLDARLSLAERAGLRIHLALCGACSRYRLQIEQIHDALQAAASWETPAAAFALSDEERARLKAAVMAAAGGARGPG